MNGAIDRLTRAQAVVASLVEKNLTYLPIVYRLEAEIVELERALRAASVRVRVRVPVKERAA